MAAKCSIARTREQKLAALRLVHQAYLRAGIADPNDQGIRVTPWHASGLATIFVAEEDGQLLYTMSVIADSPRGLPIERLYPVEIETFRRMGQRIAEVGSLAGTGNRLDALLDLCRLVFWYGVYHDFDNLLICVHPRHARFYERFWGFRPFAPVRACPYAKGAPGIGLELDFHKAAIRLPERTKAFLRQARLTEDDLWPDDDWEFLEELADSRMGLLVNE